MFFPIQIRGRFQSYSEATAFSTKSLDEPGNVLSVIIIMVANTMYSHDSISAYSKDRF